MHFFCSNNGIKHPLRAQTPPFSVAEKKQQRIKKEHEFLNALKESLRGFNHQFFRHHTHHTQVYHIYQPIYQPFFDIMLFVPIFDKNDRCSDKEDRK